MMGVLRVAWLFLAGNRLQRALLVASPTLQGLAILWYRLDASCRWCVPMEPLMLDMLSWLSLIGCLLMGAELFRAMAAPRMLRFIPGARLRLLLGVLLALSMLAGLVTLYATLARKFAPNLLLLSGSPPGTFFGALEILALWVLWGFFVFGRTVWLRWLLVVGAFPAVLVMGMQYRDIGRSLDIGVMTEFVVVAVATLIPFVVWYLRVRLIEPPDTIWAERGGLLDFRFRPRSSEVLGESAVAATNVYLLGHPSIPRACWLWASAVVAVDLLWIYFLHLPGHAPPPSLVFQFTLVGVCGYGTFFPQQIMRRARTLWIRAGCSRRELFDRVERLSLGCFAFVSLPLLAIGAIVLTNLPLDRAAYLLLLATSTGLCLVYGTLLDVHTQSTVHPHLLGLIVVTWLFLLPEGPRFLFEQSGPWALQAPLAELLAVPLLRAIAVHRWQRIDWLICKLPKSASQRLRLAR